MSEEEKSALKTLMNSTSKIHDDLAEAESRYLELSGETSVPDLPENADREALLTVWTVEDYQALMEGREPETRGRENAEENPQENPGEQPQENPEEQPQEQPAPEEQPQENPEEQPQEGNPEGEQPQE